MGEVGELVSADVQFKKTRQISDSFRNTFEIV